MLCGSVLGIRKHRLTTGQVFYLLVSSSQNLTAIMSCNYTHSYVYTIRGLRLDGPGLNGSNESVS